MSGVPHSPWGRRRQLGGPSFFPARSAMGIQDPMVETEGSPSVRSSSGSLLLQCQTLLKDGRFWPRIRRASASAGTTGARASSLPRQVSRGSSGARLSARRPDRRGGCAALPRPHRHPLFVGQRPRCALLPARLLLLLLHLQALHRHLRRGSQRNRVGHTMLLRLPCHADPPRSRASGNGRSHATGRGRMRCPTRRSRLSPRRSRVPKRSRMVGLALRPESRPTPRRPSTCV